MKTIAFLGHRRIVNIKEVKENMINVLTSVLNQGVSRVLIGCHGDFDWLALKTCLEFKKENNFDFKIYIVLTSVSFLNKGKSGKSLASIYQDMGCETTFYDIEDVYYKNRITYSNKKMIDESDLIICCVDMSAYQSGAKTAVKYALRKKKEIINLFI